MYDLVTFMPQLGPYRVTNATQGTLPDGASVLTTTY